ncbi:MAG: malto-oligosyltrehalose synthase [Thermodesulfobacteriota bacterium]
MARFRTPTATYRIQFNRDFSFAEARALVPYLSTLGISDLYASPLFKARRGSSHGYSVTNPMELNPELGPRGAFDALVRALRSRGMGLLLDIVPNHMALSPDNPWWMEVLEDGPSSPYAVFFDIDWHPPNRILEGKVLLPVLGRPYGEALEGGELRLTLEENGFCVRYHDHKFPLDPKTYAQILSHRLEDLETRLGREHPAIIGLRGLITLTEHLPSRTLVSSKKVKERQKDKEIIKKTLSLLYRGQPEVRGFLDENMGIFNAGREDPGGLDMLDRLLTEQCYRPAFWRVALELINYRRFFSINDLIGIRIEDPRVFEALKHGLLSRLLSEGKATGVRVDHIDGLYDPETYLRALQGRMAADAGGQAGEGGLYVLVEKILAPGETLPEGWPVAGTTGYDYLNLANALFVEGQGLLRLLSIYKGFVSSRMRPGRVVYEKKKLVMATLFGGEVETLGHHLEALASEDRRARDVSRKDLIGALVEVTACLPVYRTYIRGHDVEPRDRAYLEEALSSAGRATPSLNPIALGFLRSVLFLDFRRLMTEERKNRWLGFVMRWQQFTGPIMAKGLEDTALYVYNPLISLNEVGGSFQAASMEAFHRFNEARLKSLPFTMNATSTHDTKRSEDVRARINILSEIPWEWRDWLNRWSRLNGPKKILVAGNPVPDRNEEVLLYQTLIGAWPLLKEEIPAFRERLKGYMIKAAREAKVHTSWVSADTEHENALAAFVDGILDESDGNAFLDDFLQAQSRLAPHGAVNSLSQVLLKITSPGLPDFYQGTELWDFSLVDPDNRRPVDFSRAARLLGELTPQLSSSPDKLLSELLSHWADGRIKLYLTHRSLTFRRERRDLFLEGEYLPLYGAGKRGENVVAYARHSGNQWALVAVPRFTVKMAGKDGFPLGREVWGKTALRLLPGMPSSWMNILTGERVKVSRSAGSETLRLSRLFSRFPVALLSDEG